MTLEEFNNLPVAAAATALSQCCAAHAWVQAMVEARPYANIQQLLEAADKIWQSMDEKNLLEAFSAHPQIGNVVSLLEKYASTKAMAAGEQSAITTASKETLETLAHANRTYLEKFGFIFIVCATGKSVQEMLNLLYARLPNSREKELLNAAEEQRKITAIRLQKLLDKAA
jgi:2-oxo-4-hydroxy-4-carboxy-5-ureidoimidazoline decarboxylase